MSKKLNLSSYKAEGFYDNGKKSSKIKNIIKLMFPPILLAVTLFLWFVSTKSSSFTENIFSQGIYKFLTFVLGLPISFLPFSLTEFTLIIILPIFLVFFIVRLVLAIQKKKLLPYFKKSVVFLAWLLSISFFLYICLHGINFNRVPLSTQMGLNVNAKSPEFLLAVTIDLAKKATAERELVGENEDGYMTLEKSVSKTLNNTGKGFEILSDKYPFLKGAVTKTKPVMLSRYWSYTGITGMYFPLFAEANVNISQPDKSIPSTSAHELAHLRGFAREDDCNFLAYLTCINHPSADFRYSGYVMAYIYCSNALYGYNDEYAAEAGSHLSNKVLLDFEQSRTYWKNFEGPVQNKSTEINDAFIEAHGDADGVFSYDRVVSLILGFYEKSEMIT